MNLFFFRARQASPLIVAIEQRAPLHIIKWLYQKDPGAIDDQYKFGKNALHTACSRKGSPELIQYLLELRPRATKGKDSWGRTPLWRACNEPGISKEVLHMLLNPEDAWVADRGGLLPLHAAASNATPIDHLAIILGAAPETIRSKDHQGRLPFHSACAGGHATVEILQFLLDAYPGKFFCVCELPFHSVCLLPHVPNFLSSCQISHRGNPDNGQERCSALPLGSQTQSRT